MKQFTLFIITLFALMSCNNGVQQRIVSDTPIKTEVFGLKLGESSSQKAIENAQKSIPESKLGRLEKIFTIDESGKTIATIRYGTIIFYQGRMEEANVFDRHGKENFKNKLGALNHLKIMLEADDWFDPQYEKYLKIKESADKKSLTTKKLNKNNSKTISKPKVSSKKATAKKTSTKAKSKKK